MTLSKARRLAARQRQNIGRLLGKLKQIRKNPEAYLDWKETISLLKANMKDLHRLYKQYPAIKPIRSKQMNLFKG